MVPFPPCVLLFGLLFDLLFGRGIDILLTSNGIIQTWIRDVKHESQPNVELTHRALKPGTCRYATYVVDR
jgi:hypothetical protein